MIIPLGTDRPLRRPTVVNHALIAASIVAYGGMIVGARDAGPITDHAWWGKLVFIPGRWDEAWRLVGYAFLHDPRDWAHIVGNMLILWVFGPAIEDKLGRLGYLALYVVGAAVAALAHAATSPAPLIGASGAVACVTGAFLVLFPRVHVRTLLFFILIGVYDIPAAWFIGFALARDFLFQAFHPAGGVSHAAHLGGYGVGIAGAFLLLATRLVRREPFDLLSIFKHKQRLREFRAATDEAAPGVRARRDARATDEPGDPPRDGSALARARAGVAERLAAGDADGAATRYAALLADHAGQGRACALSARGQLEIANRLFQRGDHRPALLAYQVFCEAHPRDPQRPHARLAIGLIQTRYAVNISGARAELTGALADLSGEDEALARELLRELDAMERAAPPARDGAKAASP